MQTWLLCRHRAHDGFPPLHFCLRDRQWRQLAAALSRVKPAWLTQLRRVESLSRISRSCCDRLALLEEMHCTPRRMQRPQDGGVDELLEDDEDESPRSTRSQRTLRARQVRQPERERVAWGAICAA